MLCCWSISEHLCDLLQSKKTAVQAKKTVEAKKQDVTGADDKPKVATATTTSEVDEDVVEEDGKVIRRRKRRET